jgi:hypothetical protein
MEKIAPKSKEEQSQKNIETTNTETKPQEDSEIKPLEDPETKPQEDSETKPQEDSETKPKEDSEIKPLEDPETKPLEDSETKPKEDSEIKPQEDKNESKEDTKEEYEEELDNTQEEDDEKESEPTIILHESTIPFTYINDGEYSKSIESYNTNGPLKVHICAYAINSDCMVEGIENENPNISNKNFMFNKKIPFLQFVFKKDDQSQKYTFPHFTYEILNVQEEPNEDEPKSQLETDFESECFKQLFDYFTCDEPIIEEYTKCSNPDIDKDSLLEHYKGYIEHEDGIIVLFDITSWIHVLKKDYTIAIVNEILHKKKIFNSEFEPYVLDFFKKNTELTQLHNTDGSVIPYPFQVYMCLLKQSGSDGSVENMQSMKISEDEYKFIKPLFHPKLGYSYYFNNTLEDESQFENLQRVAIFVVNSLYILGEINDYDLNIEENITNFSESSTIYFHENGIQMWSIRNISHYVLY